MRKEVSLTYPIVCPLCNYPTLLGYGDTLQFQNKTGMLRIDIICEMCGFEGYSEFLMVNMFLTSYGNTTMDFEVR